MAGLTSGPAGPVDLAEAQLRADAGAARRGGADRHRQPHPAAVGPARDRGHRHRRPRGGRRGQHARPGGAGEGEHAGGPGRRRGPGVRGAGRAPAVARAVGGAGHGACRAGRSLPTPCAPGERRTGRPTRRSPQAWGTPAVDIGVGGSIAFVTAYAELVPDAEILITGVEDPDTRAHGANEGLHLARLRAGLRGRGAAAAQPRRRPASAADRPPRPGRPGLRGPAPGRPHLQDERRRMRQPRPTRTGGWRT